MQGKSGKNDLCVGEIAHNELFLCGGYAYCSVSRAIFIVDSDYECEKNTSWTDQYPVFAKKIVLLATQVPVLKFTANDFSSRQTAFCR